MHFVAKKYGLFFFNNDDVETARFIAIRNMMALLSSNTEFEDRKHLNCVIEKNFKHAIFGMMKHNQAKKRTIDIRTESDFLVDYDGNQSSKSVIENHGELEDPYDKDLINHIKNFVMENEDEDNIIVFTMFMEGYNNVEISKALEISSEAVRQRKKVLFKKIKNEINESTDRANVEEIRARVRSLPTPSHKAEYDSYSKAMSYLGFTSKVRN